MARRAMARRVRKMLPYACPSPDLAPAFRSPPCACPAHPPLLTHRPTDNWFLACMQYLVVDTRFVRGPGWLLVLL
jgi:hypothetical protein